jgi:putative membrane protein
MASSRRHRSIPEEHRAAEHLANERTFLAWVRTNIALISLGFVLARITPRLQQTEVAGSREVAVPLGIGMVGLGALLTVLAACRYHFVNRAIETGHVKDDRALIWFVTALVAVVAGTLIGFMLLAKG